MLKFTWLGEALQGQVDVVALPLPRHDKVKNLEVLAANEQRTSRGCGGLFLHAAHQAVKHLVGQRKADVERFSAPPMLHRLLRAK